ncbi:capsule biosynthesis protein [Falsiroseomonas bella]|uniref:Capsule biosynthesis protein n=2 Tax=Falsiroseomonas bella TaxID=2184016 RepID=A0A317FKJ5_9PROT|nr:capsule biosynthesis protein [Falsiroseomonas bella]
MGVRHWFALLVLLPTLIVGAYYVFYAANIYESEARFLVRNRGGGGGSAVDALAGRAGGIASAISGARSGMEESRAVAAWIGSYAAVNTIRGDIDLVEMWRRPEADVVSELWWETPQLEWLAWYFRRRVIVTLDPETGVMQLRVHAFRPADAHRLAEEVLRRSEELVNTFTARSIADTLRAAQADVDKAERRVLAAREALIGFREREQAFDPASTATGAVTTITQLQGALAQARTEYEERRRFMRPDNPQLQVLQNRVAALQQQIATERARVTRGEEALTQQVAAFERLELERMMADRELASAVGSLEAARSDALRQQVFVMRVSEPQMPEYPLYPRATFNTLTVFVSLSVLFGIGWLLVVSAREHAS